MLTNPSQDPANVCKKSPNKYFKILSEIVEPFSKNATPILKNRLKHHT